MKLQDRSQIEALAKFKSQGDLVTSFYLETDKGKMSRKEIQLALKNLVNDAKDRACGLSIAKDKLDSLLRDLDHIADHGNQALGTSNAPGLALFSASGKGFWQALELPHGPRNRFVFDANFYVRPLASILDKYSHICALLINRREAVWYDVLMDEIKLLDRIQSDVPKRVREGGFEGTAEKKIERHIDAHLQDHYKTAAKRTFDLSKKHPFDWLFIGAEENHGGDFDGHLHAYLRERIKARLRSRVTDSAAKVLQEVSEAESRLKKAEQEETVQRLIAELERGGLATSGLRDTIRRLNQFEVQSLVVAHNYSRPGRICPAHKFLYLDELKCPVDDKKTDVVADIVDEIIETVLKRGGTVTQIEPPSKLDRYGGIGAFLKYKAQA
jgi:peptide chain release factor subunit 1